MTPKFLYFDLGNVLLYFSHEQAARQMAQVAGIETEVVWQTVFASDLLARYERGAVSTAEFYEQFCQQTGKRPDRAAFEHAGSAIFRVNVPMKAVLSQLLGARWRLGLLSNTCEMHWNYFADGRYMLIPDAFEQVVLSFRVGAMKPEAKIYEVAAEMAGCAPREIFYCDDIAGHVAGAKAAGFDAVQYTDTPALVAELWKRGVRFNY